MVEVAGDDVGEGKDDLGHIDASDESLVVDEGACGNGDCLLDHGVGNQSGKEKNGVVGYGEAEDFRKDEGQDNEVKEGIEYGP